MNLLDRRHTLQALLGASAIPALFTLTSFVVWVQVLAQEKRVGRVEQVKLLHKYGRAPILSELLLF